MLWRGYLHQLHTRPMTVKACTSCLTFCTTDVLAQARERSKASDDGLPVERHDLMRTARNGMFGFLWLGPTNHIVWGKTPFGLEYWLPGNSWRAVFSRTAVDQVTNMPLNMVVFLAWPALLTGQGIEAAIQAVRASFWEGVTFAWGVWPFVHPLSFRYVPLEHRLLVLNFCSLGVFSYATWVAERNAERDRIATQRALPRGDGGTSKLQRTPAEKAGAAAASP